MDKEKIVKLINTYWRFDNDQDHVSTWHDKQDLISAIEQLTIPVVVVNEANYCTKCHKPIRMINNTLQLLCECDRSEVELVCSDREHKNAHSTTGFCTICRTVCYIPKQTN